MMQILVKCPKCDAGLPVVATEPAASITCGRCGREIPLTMSDAVRADTAVDRCPACAGEDFYLRKDFDPKIGVATVAVAVAISAVFYYYDQDFIAYAVLAAAALLDFVVYRFLKEVTVCYRCHAEFRGSYPRTASGFDLHTADVLELEYERRIGRR
jgi:DNA-directed RNA polymerase subunit RPC12/RpoP